MGAGGLILKNRPHISSSNMSSNQELTGQILAGFTVVDLSAAVGGVKSPCPLISSGSPSA